MEDSNMTRPNATLTQSDADGLVWALVDLLLLEVFMTVLEKIPEPRTAQPCLVGRALAELPNPYQEALAEIVGKPWADGGLTDYEVAIVMQEAGLRSSATTVSRHRRNLCGCRRATHD